MNVPVVNRAETERRLAECENQLRAMGVQRLALFGSILRGVPDDHSVVDLLVQFTPGEKSFDRFMALSEFLERCLGRRVDLVTMEALSPFIGPRILAEASDVIRAA